jgi:short-subunit dehydrogenase involved in D-alanine esterification of teichoic acids
MYGPMTWSRAAKALRAKGLSVSTSAFDVVDEQAVTEAIVGHAHSLDILVNNTAVQQRRGYGWIINIASIVGRQGKSQLACNPPIFNRSFE